jgi:hypothetical protein
MKKWIFVVAAIILIAMSGLLDVALSLSKDPQWTPYVQTWKQKLPSAKTNTQIKEVTECRTVTAKSENKTER